VSADHLVLMFRRAALEPSLRRPRYHLAIEDKGQWLPSCGTAGGESVLLSRMVAVRLPAHPCSACFG
jgi:hypothetical protein